MDATDLLLDLFANINKHACHTNICNGVLWYSQNLVFK